MSVWPTARRPRIALAISTGAICLAAAGGGAAQFTQDATSGSIGTSALRDGSVTGDKLADEAVGPRAIRDEAIRSRMMADNAVTNHALANNSVTSTKIAKGGVSRLDLALAARVPMVATRVVNGQIAAGVTDTVVVRCAPGETLLAGGFGGLPNTATPSGTQASVVASRPDPAVDGARPDAWLVTFANLSPTAASVAAYAVCAQTG